MKILRTYEIAPDGVRIEINWDNMNIGTSIFVPCINTEAATQEVAKICAEKGWQLQLSRDGYRLGRHGSVSDEKLHRDGVRQTWILTRSSGRLALFQIRQWR